MEVSLILITYTPFLSIVFMLQLSRSGRDAMAVDFFEIFSVSIGSNLQLFEIKHTRRAISLAWV